MKGLERGLPHAFLRQSVKVAAYGIELVEAFGQIRSRTIGAHCPDHGVEKQAVVLSCHAEIGCFAGQKRGDGGPLFVGNFMTTHLIE